jgi:hypothetical protein
MIPIEGLETTQGALKPYTKVVESGAEMISYFCAKCGGSTLGRNSNPISGGYDDEGRVY